MSATTDDEFREFNTIHTPYGDLLKSAIVFGANASGKTNIIKAIHFMGSIILSEPIRQSRYIHNNNNFALIENACSKPRIFEIEFIEEGFVYCYGFEILNNEINKEYLYMKNKRKNMLFKRSSPDFKDIILSKEMDNVKHFTANTRRDNLFLYWASWGNNNFAMKVSHWFSKIEIFRINDHLRRPTTTFDYLEKNKERKDKVLDLLQKADINILDFDIEKKQAPEITMRRNKETNEGSSHRLSAVLKTSRYYYNSNKKPVDKVNFPIYLESAGTQKIFEIAGSFLKALEKGCVIFIDEIDTRLHPLLVKNLVMMFNSISSNPNNAQLICNTHNTLLLDEDIRLDQIFFTEKDKYGVSNLYSLVDFKGVEKDNNLMRKYILGVFGAIPNLYNSNVWK